MSVLQNGNSLNTPANRLEKNASSFVYWTVYSLIAGLLLVCCFYLYLQQPVWYLSLIVEDGFGEYLTVTLYIAAALLLIHRIRYLQTAAYGYFLLLACFIFMAGEEFSWGQRIFDLSTPDSLKQINAQRELTLHNLVKISDYLPLLAIAILLWALVTPISARFKWYQWLDNKLGIPSAKAYQFPLFLLTALFLYEKPFFKGSELGELLLGFSFFCYAIALQETGKNQLSFINGIALAACITSALLLTNFYPPYSDFRTHRMMLNYNKYQLCWQSREVFQFLEENRFNPASLGGLVYSQHHAIIDQAKMLRYAGREDLAREILQARIDNVLAIEGRENNPTRNEQLGDLTLLLKQGERATDYYNHAIAYHLNRGEKAVKNSHQKYEAYIRLINLYAKVNQLDEAEKYYLKARSFNLSAAHNKQFKLRVVDYLLAKKTGHYPLQLVPNKRDSWGSWGHTPVGNCKLP